MQRLLPNEQGQRFRRQVHGHNAANARDGDYDGDGISNYDEFRLGSDPTDSQSGLRVHISLHAIGRPALRFPHLPGWQYFISHSPDLNTWTTASAAPLTIDSPGVAERIDPEPAQRYYRVHVLNQ